MPKTTKFFPFKHRRVIGPGPKRRVLARADRWACSCKREGQKQICDCKGLWKTKSGRPTRAKRRVVNDLKAKRAYGKIYRAWKKRQPKRRG